MQQESKIGFLWQYVIACIHPSQYKELIKKKKGAFVGYVAVLVMFLVLIEKSGFKPYPEVYFRKRIFSE